MRFFGQIIMQTPQSSDSCPDTPRRLIARSAIYNMLMLAILGMKDGSSSRLTSWLLSITIHVIVGLRRAVHTDMFAKAR